MIWKFIALILQLSCGFEFLFEIKKLKGKVGVQRHKQSSYFQATLQFLFLLFAASSLFLL